jgi:DHA2 family multidrug resistance protein
MTDAVPAKTWVGVIGSSIGAFMAVLNIHVTNACLSDIQGAIGAGIDEGGWISTAYLVAEIVAMPLSGWLAEVFSTRRYLIVNTALFLTFSVACAFARDLGQMIAFRALQGFFGGALIPLAFMVAISLPPARRATGMAIFSAACTLGPVIGPTVGGALNEAFGWQSVFMINLVPGLVMLALLWASLERKPLRLDLLRGGDWLGIAAVAIGLGALQTVLEEGEKNDWLAAPWIAQLFAVAVVALILFVGVELAAARPLVNLRLLGRRNFLGGALAQFLLGLVSYGTVFMLPLYLARVQGYNSAQIGMVMVWTGLPQLLVLPLMPWLMRLVDSRWLVAFGLLVFAASFFMNVGITTDLAGEQLLVPNIVRAIGQAIVETPISTLAVVGIGAANTGSASVLLNVIRNVGGAIGIASLYTFLLRREHFHSTMLGQSVTLFDPDTRQRIDHLMRYFQERGVVDPATAWNKAVAAIAGRIHEQAYTMAFGDVFFVLGTALLLALLTLLMLRRPAAAR